MSVIGRIDAALCRRQMAVPARAVPRIIGKPCLVFVRQLLRDAASRSPQHLYAIHYMRVRMLTVKAGMQLFFVSRVLSSASTADRCGDIMMEGADGERIPALAFG